MYLAFIDESGTIQKNDPQSQYYILVAIIMQEKGMKYLHRETQLLKNEIWRLVQGKKKMPDNFEIHMQDILDAKKSFKPLRGIKVKTEEILKKIYEFINKLYITIISIIMDKKEFYNKYKESEFLRWALKLMIERLNGHIWKESTQNGDKEYALLFMDEDFSTDKKKRGFISQMMQEGIKFQSSEVDRVLDTPIFIKSELHNGIQIADSIAYLIGRYTRKVLDKKGTTLFDSLSNYFLLKLGPRFYGGIPSSRSNKGIKFFPSSAPSNYFNVFNLNNY